LQCDIIGNKTTDIETDKQFNIKNMKRTYYGIILMVLMLAAGMKCIAQTTDKSANKQVMLQSQEAVDAIAMYPTDTRKIIFESCEYPELIAKLSAMQKNTQGAFGKLISSLNQKEQEKIWNLTRYDGLIANLAISPKKPETEMNAVSLNFPQEIRKTALEEHKKNYNLLVQIDQMNQRYASDFESLLNNYSPEAKAAFREMINMPEVLTILNNYMEYTVIVGNYYKKNPERILHKTDSLNIVLTQKNTQEVNDWKQSMNDDPKAQKEYVEAAQEYAQDNGYRSEDYNSALTPNVTDYSMNPYDWWLGYPSWYPDNSWNPYPYWYDWGFYFSTGRRAVFFGLPSAYFMDWYFYNPQHFSKYANLANNYYNYYDKHPQSLNYNSISHRVNDWRNRNKDIVTDEWDFDKNNRVERFRQFGQMEVDWGKYNRNNQKKQTDRSVFIQRASNRYYFLAADVSNRQINQNSTRTTFVSGNIAAPVRRPTVIIPTRFKADEKPVIVNTRPTNNITTGRESNSRPANVNIQPRSTNVSRQPVNSNQMRNAQQFQQNTWTQQPRTQPEPQARPQPQSRPEPQARPQPQPQSQPRPEPQQNRTPQPSRQPEVRQAVQPVRQNIQPESTNRR
jgi:hypothetical protein